jgi:hypothetical protein
MIGAEMVTHEGYDIPREVFASFFGIIADTVKAALRDDWTSETDAAWRALLADIDHYVGLTPRSDVSNPFFEQQREAFERPFANREG